MEQDMAMEYETVRTPRGASDTPRHNRQNPIGRRRQSAYYPEGGYRYMDPHTHQVHTVCP